MGSTQRQREFNPRNRNRDRGRGRGREWCPGVGGGAGQVRYLRGGATRPMGRRRGLSGSGRPPVSRGVALLDRGGPLRGRGRWWGGRDGRCGSIYVYPAVRRGVGLRGGAARQVEAVSDGGEGVRGRSGRAGAGLVSPSVFLSAVLVEHVPATGCRYTCTRRYTCTCTSHQRHARIASVPSIKSYGAPWRRTT